MAQYSENMESELAEVEAAARESGASTFEEARDKAQLLLEDLSRVTLNIAVTGVTGAGKSSLVNAMRGVPDWDERAAATDVVQCTMEPKKYQHPTMPNVNIWDLPGIGTTDFQASAYLKDVKFNEYDFFLILTSSRVQENDIKLAKEIKKSNKKFYFVRTKMDQAVKDERRKGKTAEQTVNHIRHYLEENLKKQNMLSTPIFLVSSRKLAKFNFNDLMWELEKDLPWMKRDALTQSLPVYSRDILDKKYKAFKKVIWAFAFASSAVGAIPLPGLSAAFDLSITLAFLTTVYHSFGLDERSVKQLSDRLGVEIPTDVQKSELLKAIATRSIPALGVELSTLLALTGIQTAVVALPIIGSVIGATLSFCTTIYAFRMGLNELYRIAQKVIEMAQLK